MTMQGGGCRIEELERLDGRKFALDLILNHLEGRITPYGVVYDNGMKLEQLYDGRHFPCYHYQPNLLAVGFPPGRSRKIQIKSLGCSCPAPSNSSSVELHAQALTSTMPASGMRTVCFHPRWRRSWRDNGRIYSR